MINIRPNDLVAIEHEGRFYYAIVLSKAIMLGAQLAYAFYHTTEELDTTGSVLSGDGNGVHFIVDFLMAKRRNCLHRISRNVHTEHLNSFLYYRQSRKTYGLNRTWAIWDRNMRVVSAPEDLTDEQWSYPVLAGYQYERMCMAIDQRWKPEHDKATEGEFMALFPALLEQLSEIGKIRKDGVGEFLVHPDHNWKNVGVFISRKYPEEVLVRAARTAMGLASPGWEIWFTPDHPDEGSLVVTATTVRNERQGN